MSNQKRKSDLIAVIIMIVLSVILLPILAVNLTLIIKGGIHKDVPPDVFGIAPLAVTSGSMDGDEPDSFGEGALIFVKILNEQEKQALKVGDIVTFRFKGGYVTHRIISLTKEGDTLLSVETKGDYIGNTPDGNTALENIVGKCVGSVEGLGDFAMFLREPEGILLFVGIPVLAYIVYDVIRIVLYNRRVKAEGAEELESAKDELKAKEEELARLRALVEKQTQGEAAGGNVSSEAEGQKADETIPKAEGQGESHSCSDETAADDTTK